MASQIPGRYDCGYDVLRFKFRDVLCIMKKVSIIILNYQGYQDTIDCVESLKKIDYPNFDIVIVDNASCNESAEELHEFIADQGKVDTKLMVSAQNWGFAAGNNIALREVFEQGSDYALILNPDTIVTGDFLTKLVTVSENPSRYSKLRQEIKKGKEMGFLGPRIFYEDKKTIYYNGGVIKKNLEAYLQDHGKKSSELKPNKEPFVTDYVTGTCLLVSKELYNKVGPMDEDYFMYYEDADWALQAQNKNFFHAVAPEAVIYHKGYQSTGYLSYFYIYYLVRNGYFLAKKQGTSWQKLYAYIFSVYKFLKQPIKFLIPGKRKWAKPVIHATWDFWRGQDGKTVMLDN